MKKVVYQGPSDIRILSSADVQSVGVEEGVFRKTEFYRDQPEEVDESVHDALIENPDVFGKFATFEEVDEEPREASDDEPEVEVGEATSTGANQESTGTPTTRATRSTGSATGGRTAGSTGRSTTGGSSRTS